MAKGKSRIKDCFENEDGIEIENEDGSKKIIRSSVYKLSNHEPSLEDVPYRMDDNVY